MLKRTERDAQMEFRPCIDIHEGKVKQLVGGSLTDFGNDTKINYIAKQDASFYAKLYKSYNIQGGHVIMLTPEGHAGYEETKQEALRALKSFPGGLQVGGGINAVNADEFLEAGATHVIVTSYVFKDGQINYENLEKLVSAVGKEHLVLDLSCRRKDDNYYIMTDRWQKYTNVILTEVTMKELSRYCDEYLIHAVDVEGKVSGVESDLLRILGNFKDIPITYAGGIHSMEDIDIMKKLGRNHVNATIGSAIDLFGGNMKFEEVLKKIREEQ